MPVLRDVDQVAVVLVAEDLDAELPRLVPGQIARGTGFQVETVNPLRPLGGVLGVRVLDALPNDDADQEADQTDHTDNGSLRHEDLSLDTGREINLVMR